MRKILAIAVVSLALAACDQHPDQTLVPAQSVEKIGDFDNLDGVKLGTKQLDLTLVYGRPNCGQGGPDESTDQSPPLDQTLLAHASIGDPISMPMSSKTWRYARFDKCGLAIILEAKSKNPNDWVVTKLCSPLGPPEFKYDEEQETIIQKLGQPTSTSINEAGTEEIFNFANHHLAVKVGHQHAEEWCVTPIPVRFPFEYKKP